MPSRILREGILTSDRVNALSTAAEVFYRRLMSVVDDYGRFDGRPGILRVSCYPLRVDAVREADLSRWIAECVKAGLLVLYAVDGKPYLEMQDFKQQARAKSKFPSPADGQMLSVGDADATQPPSDCLADATQTQTPVHLFGVGVGGVSEGEVELRKPSASTADKPPPIPACPHRKILALYAESLPMLPQPKPELWAGQRAKHLSARWKWLLTATKRSGERYARTEDEALDWFRRFFVYVAESDFLTGRSGKFTTCDLGWLVNEENFAKVVQGNYENREAA